MNKNNFFKILGFFIIIFIINFSFILSTKAEDAAANTKCQDYVANEIEWEKASNDILYSLEVPFGDTLYVKDFVEYLLLIYAYAVNLGAILAVVVIMYGGFRWAISAGNEQAISSSRETITSAIIGLIILLSSYIILNFINPQLVLIEDAEIYKIPIQIPYETECAADPEDLVSLEVSAVYPPTEESDTSTEEVENFVIDDSLEEAFTVVPTQKKGKISAGTGCPTLKTSLEKAAYNLAVYNYNNQVSREITGSGFRALDRQWELRQCYCHALLNEGECFDGACPDCKNCGACNPASEPCGNGQSYHPKGIAVDVRFSDGIMPGKSSWRYNSPELFGDDYIDQANWDTLSAEEQATFTKDQKDLKDIMNGTGDSDYQATGIRGIGNEWWHFQLSAGDSATCKLTCSDTNKPSCGLRKEVMTYPSCDLNTRFWFCGTKDTCKEEDDCELFLE